MNKKKNLAILFIVIVLQYPITGRAGLIMTYDKVNDTKLTNINKKLIEQLEQSNEILKETIKINDSLTGGFRNTRQDMSMNQLLDLMILRSPIGNFTNTTQEELITRQLDGIFPKKNQKIKKHEEDKAKQQKFQQQKLKEMFILSTKIINNNKNRREELEMLVGDLARNKSVKESLDFANKLNLENLIQQHQTNLLLAFLVRNQATEKYEGEFDFQVLSPREEKFEPASRYFPRNNKPFFN